MTNTNERHLYLECSGGASGDMLLAALCDGLISADSLMESLRRDMPFFRDVALEAKSVEKYGLRGRQLVIRHRGVDLNPPAPEAPAARHHHDEEAPFRNLAAVERLLVESALPGSVKRKAFAVFERIARAEAHVHGTAVEQVHFHEISAADTLVDIIGFCMAVHQLGVQRVHCSPLPLGNGTVTFSHGTWPVPAPATIALLQNVPVYKTDAMGELVTPTGAALIAEFADAFGRSPVFEIDRTGVGFGTAHRPRFPNVLRAILAVPAATPARQETIQELVTAVDDISGVELAHAMDEARERGALDAYFIPAYMKKGRPGWEIHVLCKPEDAEVLRTVLFQHARTLGIRSYSVPRVVLPRSEECQIRNGHEIGVKIVETADGSKETRLEYESLRKIAKSMNVPLHFAQRQVAEEPCRQSAKNSND